MPLIQSVALGALSYLIASNNGPLAVALCVGIVAGLMGLALSGRLAGLQSRIEQQARLASVDDLTGLANARTFREVWREGTWPRPLAGLAVIDVDRFKSYNDAFGHPAGDRALSTLGATLARFEAGTTRLYRVGGDEFAATFEGVGADRVAETAESIRRAVAGHDWPHRPITVSIGVAVGGEAGPLGLEEQADRAHYRAKQAGGDRVVAHSAEGSPPT